MKAHLVDSERAASTYSYQNEKQQVELEEASLYQRKPLHANPLSCIGFQTCAPLNYKLSLKLIMGYLKKPFSTNLSSLVERLEELSSHA